jgi:pSer/pThr/pTyr-binding forkhead associated (FHA) protein
VLSVHELHRIAASMKADEFEKQLGPFVLVQRPPDQMTQQRAIQLGARRTIALDRNQLKDALSLLLEFEDLSITTLPPLDSHENLSVGRLPDCDVVVDDPSVSKHHATLSWDETLLQGLVTDLQSSNGTQVNGVDAMAPTAVRDGDEVCFGEARFLFMRSKTFHARLAGRPKAP